MKLAKSLLLGSAAGLVAVTGVQAADLPVRAAAPVDYVRTCPAQGAGFFFIPGTETCLRIFGFARFQAEFDERRTGPGFTARDQNDFTLVSRGELSFDSRTATEWGTLRGWVRLGGAGGGTVEVERALVQFGGFSAGRVTSFFDFWGGSLLRGGLQGDGTANLFAYTATFGAGLSATVSLEDPRRRTTGGMVYGGRNFPDLVANIRADQAWGAAMLAGAIHQVRPDAATALIPGVSDKTGWALNAGVQINLPMLAPRSSLRLNATYTDGAIGYTSGLAGGRDFRRETFGGFADAYVVGNSLRTTKSWLLSGAINHFWTPQVESILQASYGEVDVPTGVLATTARDTTFWQVGKRVNWTPVSGLLIAGEATYTEGRRTRVAADPVTFRRNDSRWGATIRIQRDF